MLEDKQELLSVKSPGTISKPVVHETAVKHVNYYRLVNVLDWQLFLLMGVTLIVLVGSIFAYRYFARLISDEAESRFVKEDFLIEKKY